MTAAPAALPDDLADVRKHVARALSIIAERRDGYVLAQQMYDGTRAEVHANRAIRKRLEASAEAHPISLAHIPVDALIDRVALSSLTSEHTTGAKVLEAAWPSIEDDVDDWLLRAGYLGDYYVIIDPTAEADDGTIDGADVLFVGSSPLTTVAVYDRATERTLEYGVKRWYEGGSAKGDRGVWRAQVFYDDCTVYLRAQGGPATPPELGQWMLDGEVDRDGDGDIDPSDAAIVPHEGGHPLLVHLAVDSRPYGTPLHRKAYGPQDAITKLSASNLATTDAQAYPARYALLDPAAEVDDEDTDDWAPDGSMHVGTDGEQQSKLKADPSTIAMLKGVKSAGTFESATGDVFYKGLDWYVRVMALATGTPAFEFDLNGEQPSGEARRRAEGRIDKHAQRVIRRATATLETLGETLLGLAGIVDDTKVKATFRPTGTATDSEGITLVGEKIKVGVPVRTALLEAGYTDEQVAEWWPDGAPAVPYTVLTTLAGALQQLGAAKTLGVINDAELRALLPEVLQVVRTEGQAADERVLELEADETVEPADTAPTDAEAALADAQVKRALLEAQGVGARAGADPEQLATYLGIVGVSFPNVPTTVRIPEEEAAGLEGSGAAAPSPAAAPEPPVAEQPEPEPTEPAAA